MHPSSASKSSRVRILIADDHALVREGLRKILGLDKNLEIVGEAASAAEVISRLSEGDVDVLLLDLLMPGASGVDLIQRVIAAHRALPVLVLTMHAYPHLARRSLEAGAMGYLTKDSSPELVIDAIHHVSTGRSYVDPCLAGAMLRPGSAKEGPLDQLSARERQVLMALVRGRGTADIAGDLQLAANTVSTYKGRLMEKLGQESLSGLVRYALKLGILQ
jgi:DNA-binding NarL/FixJ family response regulator